MFVRMILLVFFVFTLVGCAANSKKQTLQSQPAAYERAAKAYQQESYHRDYDNSDKWAYDNYEKSTKKTYSETVIELNPRQIQQALKKAGFYKGGIDGKIGPKTKEAIIKFQKALGLKADGIAGRRTCAELKKYL